MSLYNMINGFNPACLFILPILGRPMDGYPRFRDCFVTEENNIAVYTRVGGGNRGCGFGEEELYKDKNFITTYDDDFDNTYATYEFAVPDEWREDFDKIMNGKLSETSNQYKNLIVGLYPDLADRLFNNSAES